MLVIKETSIFYKQYEYYIFIDKIYNKIYKVFLFLSSDKKIIDYDEA